MIREIQGKIRKIRARFEDSKEIPEAVDMIPNRVEPLGCHLLCIVRYIAYLSATCCAYLFSLAPAQGMSVC